MVKVWCPTYNKRKTIVIKTLPVYTRVINENAILFNKDMV